MSKNDEKLKKNKPKILTKYDQFVVPRLRDIPVWVREGLTDDEIAKRLNIHIWTLGDYRRKHPKFAEALERPTKWETHVYPRLAEIQQWFQEGVDSGVIVKNLGIAPATWYEYIDKHPMLAELVKWSKSVIISHVETSLLKAATGYEYEEIKTIIEEDKNGKKKTRIEKVKRHQPPNPTAMIFYLKNRAPNEWNDRREIIIDTKAAELERKQLFLQMIDADAIEAEYEAIEESNYTEEGFEEPDA
ncbi:transposase [Paenibacillus agricola]|uniref:Transposase n=1 Tax=Paenibacillus agricola TaxID=2716264 RepID=A0ABX0JEV8_9BACL|nr:transposase [Paenibacillus agricola]NHN34697.1 transposase [Paenibacillus agricola]